MTKPLNWGILGAAKFAYEHMGPAIHAARGAHLAALATSSAEKFAAFSDKFGALRHHDSYDALLADDTIDAVYIPLPNSLHVEWGLKALEAGKHVLIEKPVAMKADEIDALIAARDRTGLMATEAYMIVHHPQWQRTKALLAEGAVGRLRQVSCAFSFDNRDLSNIRNKPDMGGGALPDIGVYALGCARFATGAEFENVAAQIEWENGVDTMSRIQASIAGAGYQGYVSTRMHAFQEVAFHGEEGMIKLPAPFNPNVYDMGRIELQLADGVTRVERFPAANHYVNQVEAFCAAVQNGADYPWSLENAKGTQATIDAVYAAAG
ncbi:Gfo/Idh/MocA family protein [Litoreibacter janthinus]|uniref:Predicted dehydrogenase n=1 Tax=Litoreibacter janthinus TaxID=670154 RepID=A0A1I6HME5_9RHOB|nr:Gfo/Idh/MocA family oxidoreductase [Litoreibacter janthinus]SFR55584.1 Predicted dehydrogenase [Litoreibacter janthinus]